MAHPHTHSTCSAPHHCSPDVRRQVLAISPLTRDLPEDQRTELSEGLHARSWAADEPIFRAGQELSEALLIVAGRVRVTHDTAEGQELTVQIACPGDVLGSVHAHPETLTETATAIETTCALVLPSDRLAGFVRDYPGLALSLMHLQQRSLNANRAHEIGLVTRTVPQRVATALLDLNRKIGVDTSDGGRLLQVKLRRTDIAGLAGTTVESASRAMATLKKQGVIDSGREWVTIRDLAALEELLS